MMQITDVLPLFPKVFLIGKLDTQYEIKNFIDQDIKRSSTGLFGKTDGNLHERKEFSSLTEDILKFINKSIKEVYCYSDVEPYITMMWATKSGNGDYIHRHYHPNSFISGVYYPFECDYSPIKFYNPNKKLLEPNLIEMNVLNANNMIFKPMGGDIFLFPSELEHETMPNVSEIPRYSISFNVFLKGKFGFQHDLAYIEL